MRYSNNFGLTDIENALGLTSTVKTVQNTQNIIDNLAPKIQWVDDHKFQFLLGWFLLTVIAVVLGNKFSK